jgi:hypothetical protein
VAPYRVDLELVRRVDDAVVAWGEASQAHDPRLAFVRAGHAVGTLDPARPELDRVNRIAGLRAADLPELEGLLARYALAGVAPWLELAPHDGYEALAAALHAAGAAQIGFLSLLAAPAGPPPPARADVAVERVDAGALDAFGQTLLAGFEAPPDVWAEDHEHVFRHWPRDPGTSLYVARLDGRPAAAAVLFVHEGVGYLANASTVPAFRGRGAQAALIRRRLADAAAAGCELVAALTTVAGQSQRNLERGGLRVLANRAVWRVLGGHGPAAAR